MAIIVSEFHFFQLFIDGACFRSTEALHAEFSFKLGLPTWYESNWDALLDCLSSIGSRRDNLCLNWDWVDGKRLVLLIRNFSSHEADPETLLPFLKMIAEANDRLAVGKSQNRIWASFHSSSSATG
ncbi:MAG TPA: barstar family protein [Planctomycetota bacterium]|jgi:RNAse (barnase) inhibitor barstar|nr:barstar family protein [Planctomycetota bacterium]